MSLLNLLTVLARRWVVVLIGLALTAAGCYQVLQIVDTQYQASSQMVLLLPPEASGTESPTNPFLNVQSGQETVASLVAGNVATPDVRRALAKAGHTAEYDVAVLPGAGPILVITSNDDDPGNAVATRDAVMAEIDTQLAALQDRTQVPERQVLSGDRTAVSARAEALGGSRIRALAGAAAAGLLATLLATLLLDRVLTRRRPAPEAPEAPGEAGAGEPDDVGGGPRPPSALSPRAPGDKRTRRAS
ncbi:hypothetical protein [Nocardioides pantholopis]|uniref:hypothetical protein n=1 Tax=Nocardioides pantholopis TaxID=2483798 RepID=UPI000F08E525|nr:hypothetical protein [Nocardioides pantholopis]